MDERLSGLDMLGEIIEASQGSASAVAFESAVLELLQREVGFDIGYFSVKGHAARPTAMAIDTALVARAVALSPVYLRELAPVKQAALGGRGVAVDSQVLGLERLRKTRYHRELSQPAGVQHTLLAYVPWHGEAVAAIMLGRAGGFSEPELGRLESALAAIGVGRAAFGFPWVSDPLWGPARPGLWARLGLARQARTLESVPTSSGTLQVRDRGDFREMVAVEGRSEVVWTRAALQDPSESGWPYVDLFHIAAALAKQRQRALFIGCGGGVSLRQFASVYPSIALDVVERELSVIDLARSWYALDAIPNLTVHVADGIDFVRQAPASYWDIALIDAFDTTELASDFTRRSFFAQVRRILRPGGTLALNVIGTLDGHGPLAKVVHAARAEFCDVRIVPVMLPNEPYAAQALRNIVVVAKR